MEEISLDAQIRKEIGKQNAKKIRSDNFVPAILYGEEEGPTPLKVDRRTLEKIVRGHKGQNLIFRLNVLEGDKKIKDYAAIIKEEHHHPVSDGLVHLDFQRISLKKEIVVKVPLALKGEPVTVKQKGGLIDQLMWELDCICLPTNIPDKIEIDVSLFDIGHSVHVRELRLPDGVRTKQGPESIVVTATMPMKEEVEPVAAAAEAGVKAEPEVIKKKPKEEAKEEAAPEKAEKTDKADKGKEK